jgi:hypothetical protein
LLKQQQLVVTVEGRKWAVTTAFRFADCPKLPIALILHLQRPLKLHFSWRSWNIQQTQFSMQYALDDEKNLKRIKPITLLSLGIARASSKESEV